LKHSKNVAIFGISILAALLMIGLVANQAMAAPPAPKTTLCHVQGTPDLTITVGDKKQVLTHLKHGDHIGACNVCGDGLLDDKEQSAGYCDDGNQLNTDACTNACAVAACGDGYTQAGEACDDGNQDNTDSCTTTCAAAACGDGYTQAGEACDDGNQSNTDACTNACELAACGDGYTQDGVEACDGGGYIGSVECGPYEEPVCDQTCNIVGEQD
jgi:cysteine-rich repeat protein